MKITNHKFEGVAFTPARWAGVTIVPEIVILHDTAGRLEKRNSARYLADNDAKVSAHFVIERDGTITQLVPTNRAAFHAGQSSYHGRAWCNNFSIGIEIVNPGKMAKIAGGDVLRARAWWKQTFTDGDDCDLVEAYTPEHGAGVWMDYTNEQIAAVAELLETLFRDIPTLRDITTHWYVSPGRKVDTNPLFPLDAIRSTILGRDDPAATVADMATASAHGAVRIKTAGSNLNLRRWPSFNPNVIGSIPNGEVVVLLGRGDPTSPAQGWDKVLYDGREGWVLARYTETA